MYRSTAYLLMLSVLLLSVAGCGPARQALSRAGEDATAPAIAAVPTFTPTPAPPPPTAIPAEPEAASAQEAAGDPASTPAPAAQSSEMPEDQTDAGGDAAPAVLPTLTPPPTAAVGEVSPSEPLLTVVVDAANVRKGPGTDYETAGVALRAAQYPLTGRSAAGDWWQVCCFNGEPGWLYGELTTTENADAVAVITDVPPPPAAPAEPVALVPPVADAAPEQQPPVAEPEAQPEPPPAAEEPAPQAPAQHSGTAGSFDPEAQYQIVHYRVLGFDDNNGGIFNKGGQHFIFLTVLDQNGVPLDGAVVKDAVGDKLNVVSGSKSPGTAEITMDWDPYKLFVAADPSGAVSSQVSNQMNTAYPHIPDVVGMLGPVDNEYAICPTPDDRCTPPFYHAHWSYEITFQKVR